MQFAIAKAAFEPILMALHKSAADPKSPVPALTCLHFASRSDGLLIEASNLVSTVRTTLPADVCTVHIPGDICIPAEALLRRVQAMPEGNLNVDINDLRAVITTVSGQRRFMIHGLPGQDWPDHKLVRLDEASALKFAVPTGVLNDLLRSVERLASTNEEKLVLTHVNLVAMSGTLTAVATDGGALGLRRAEVAGAEGGNRLLPGRGTKALQKILESELATEKEVYVTMGDNFTFGVSVGRMTFVTGTSPLPYLPYQEAVLDRYQWSDRVVVRRDHVLEVLSAARLAADNGGVIFSLKKGRAQHFEVHSKNPDSGTVTDEVQIENVIQLRSDEDRAVKVDPILLHKAIAPMEEEVVISVPIGARDPLLLCNASEDGTPFGRCKHLGAVMPMAM